MLIVVFFKVILLYVDTKMFKNPIFGLLDTVINLAYGRHIINKRGYRF